MVAPDTHISGAEQKRTRADARRDACARKDFQRVRVEIHTRILDGYQGENGFVASREFLYGEESPRSPPFSMP